MFTLTGVLCLLAVCGCGGQPSGESKSGSAKLALLPALRGNIQVDGSSTVRPIGEAVAKRYGEVQRQVQVDVGGRGTGNGFKRLIAKEIDFSQASRPVTPNEAKLLAEAGVEFLEVPVAYDGLTIVVHSTNDWVKELTVEQLKKIYAEDSTANNWSDIDPSWPNKPLKLFAPGTGSGTYDYFCEVIGGKLRTGISLNEDDNALVTGVSGNQYSLGFFGVAYFEENRSKLRAIPIVNPKTGVAVLPERAAIEKNDYSPFSRPLFVYVNRQSLDRAEVRSFLKFYIESAPELVQNVGYVKLPSNVWAKVNEMVANPQANLGSRFLNGNGEKKEGSFLDLFLGQVDNVKSETPAVEPAGEKGQ
ncbi:MAG: PstS family phosphate ABC transporter substrate-binding protein [Pirellulaceae bacterium]|nr:PstS family phosphate ABC transporter substrate-binding protein [Pirellulaceae bacterium]